MGVHESFSRIDSTFFFTYDSTSAFFQILMFEPHYIFYYVVGPFFYLVHPFKIVDLRVKAPVLIALFTDVNALDTFYCSYQGSLLFP